MNLKDVHFKQRIRSQKDITINDKNNSISWDILMRVLNLKTIRTLLIHLFNIYCLPSITYLRVPDRSLSRVSIRGL